MSYKLNFDSGAAVIPVSALEKLSTASEKDIKALSLLIKYGISQREFDAVAEDIIRAEHLDMQSLLMSCAFWNGAGVLVPEGEKARTVTAKEAPAATNKKLETGSGAETVSSKQLIEWMDKSKKTQAFVKACEDIYGDIFNQTELSIVLTFYKEYKMKDECILMILGYCRENGYTMAYAKRIFMRMVDNGINSPADVKREIEFMQKNNSYEAMVKRIFGIDRALASREKPIIEKWHREFSFTEEEVTLAFDRAAAVNKATLAYCNKILTSWREDGLKNAEDIKSYLASKKDSSKSGGKNSSFATDDFFAAAVSRSYEKKDGDN